jgi:hypothetical protein
MTTATPTRRWRSRPPHPAKILVWASGRTLKEFAAFHGCSVTWVATVLDGRERAPARFRAALAEFVGVDESELGLD